MNLREIQKHMVDLRRSEWDKERSDPKTGKYFFTNGKKVYLTFNDYKDSQTRPNFAYRWVAYDEKNDFRNFMSWQQNLQAEVARYDDPLVEVWPEPLVPDAEGKYKYKDLVLMRIPLEVWVNKIEEDRGRYDKAREGLDKKFKAECKSEGAEYDVI